LEYVELCLLANKKAVDYCRKIGNQSANSAYIYFGIVLFNTKVFAIIFNWFDFCHFNPHLYANGFEKLLSYQRQNKYTTLIRQSKLFWELCSILKLIIFPLLNA